MVRRFIHLYSNGRSRRVARLQGEATFCELSKQLYEPAISAQNDDAPARYSSSHDVGPERGLSAALFGTNRGANKPMRSKTFLGVSKLNV